MCIDPSYSGLFLLMFSSDIPGSSRIFTPALTHNCRHALIPFHPLWLSSKWELLYPTALAVQWMSLTSSNLLPFPLSVLPLILYSKTWVTGNLPRVVVSHNAVVICGSQTKRCPIIWIYWRNLFLGIPQGSVTFILHSHFRGFHWFSQG